MVSLILKNLNMSWLKLNLSLEHSFYFATFWTWVLFISTGDYREEKLKKNKIKSWMKILA